MSYNPGVLDVVKGPYLQEGSLDSSLYTTLSLNRGDLVVKNFSALDPNGNPTWRLAINTDIGVPVFGVVTPSDNVGAFAGNAFMVEGSGNAAGLGTIPSWTYMGKGVSTGGAGDGDSPEAVDPIGTSRSSGNITDGYFKVTAIPLNIPGNEYRVSRYKTDDTSVAVGAIVEVNASSVFAQSATGRWQVLAKGVEYQNNKNDKTFGGIVARQGGPVDTITITFVGTQEGA